MTQFKPGSIKLILKTSEFVFWQLLYFFLSIYVLSFLDDILSVLFDYDSVKNDTSIGVIKYCTVFLFIVAIPRTVVAIINKPQLFHFIGLTSLISMALYLFYNYYNSFGLVYRFREFFVLLFSLIISYGITIPLLKELPRHIIKKSH